MSVNGINTSSQTAAAAYAYSSTSVKQTTKAEGKEAAETKAADSTKETAAAVYEPSEQTDTVTKKTYTPNQELIDKLKSDADAQTQNLKSLVEKLITQQATTNGNATDIWSFLREGNFTVDPQTKKEAQEAISEDGYWGVKQTSDRIVSFATALTGGDPDKIDSMMEAFKKGYKQAEKTWGGELPEISKKTYDAVLEKFQKLKDEANGVTVEA